MNMRKVWIAVVLVTWVAVKRSFSMMAMTAIFILGIANGFVAAADYPNRPITLIVPQAPGGSTDVLGRAFASVAEKHLGQGGL